MKKIIENIRETCRGCVLRIKGAVSSPISKRLHLLLLIIGIETLVLIFAKLLSEGELRRKYLVVMLFLFSIINIVLLKLKRNVGKINTDLLCMMLSQLFIKLILIFMAYTPIIFLFSILNWFNLVKISIILFLFNITAFLLNIAFKGEINVILVILVYIVFITLSEVLLWRAIALFIGYYFVNWLSSEDSVYYYLKKPAKIESFITEKEKFQWARQKAEGLFIFISSNLSMAIKETLPQNIKSDLVKYSYFMLDTLNLGSRLSQDWINNKIIASSFIILTMSCIYLIIKISLSSRFINIPIFNKLVKTQITLAKSIEEKYNSNIKKRKSDKSKKKCKSR